MADENGEAGGNGAPRDEVAFAEAAAIRERQAKRTLRKADRARRRQLRRRWLRRHGPMLVVGPLAVILVVAGLSGTGPLAGLASLTSAADDSIAKPPPRPPASDATTDISTPALRRLSPSDTALAVPTTATTPSSTTTIPEFPLLDYKVGDCVIWEQGVRHTTSHVVSCDEPHLIEITGSTEVLAAQAPYPSPAEFQALSETGDCHRFAVDYMQGRLDPHGRFDAGSIIPLPDAWVQGQHTVWCGIELSTVDDRIPTSVGRVRAQDQSFLYGTGTCLATGPDDTLTPLRCDQPHVYEVTGVIDLSGRAAAVPTDPTWTTIAHTDCVAVASQYLGRPYSPGLGTTTWLLTISAESWNAGSRRTNCFIYRVDGKGNEVSATGSIRTR